MAESQNIEWKESWRDEYLKWICGFANAQGGRIYNGTRDDGTVIGVEESKKLLEDIPNKIQNTLGIIADVNLLSANGLDYIEIVVNPSSYPVNYKGEYHYRSGSTKQQLRGAALTQFIGEKTGLSSLCDFDHLINSKKWGLLLIPLLFFFNIISNRFTKADCSLVLLLCILL